MDSSNSPVQSERFWDQRKPLQNMPKAIVGAVRRFAYRYPAIQSRGPEDAMRRVD